MANNKVILGNEVLIDLTDSTVNPNVLLAGYKAYDASGSAVNGSMPNQGTKTASLNAGQSYTIPQGYHSGSGVVTANSLASQTVGTATANDIASGLTAWVNGTKLTGTATAGGATITVTYNSSFYNKTITCSNGSKTYTKTTTSSGSTEFSVSDEGTWTITCNGVSRTVYVVLNYYTQMAITKTITVYSAANDTISFTDSAGSKTVTTNSSGQGSVNITFIPPSANITFTSSVAKNPDNLSANYSKTITITENTTSINVMPDGALYWYGWRASSFTLTPSLTETANTNSVKFTSTRESTYAYFISDVTNFSKLRCITVQSTYRLNSLILHSSATELNANGRWSQNSGMTPTVDASIFMNNTTTPGTVSTLTPVMLNISSYTGNKCVGLGMYYTNFYSEINALWLE